jgi:TonB family protein
VSLAIDRGNCPSEPPPTVSVSKTSKTPQTTEAGAKPVDTVYVLTLISDTGYVCSARALKGPSKELKKSAENAIRKWKFQPVMKGGRPFPVAVTVAVTFRMNGEGTASPQVEQQPSSPKN